ncbi:hypothetical protein B0H14DRAFT_3466279 [Mycena olivaceomarginata]|nr:hypothetical protein B0H14DRAFT_3466279 [Mycena olivaceomarginata]
MTSASNTSAPAQRRTKSAAVPVSTTTGGNKENQSELDRSEISSLLRRPAPLLRMRMMMIMTVTVPTDFTSKTQMHYIQ